jgi:hypothetical protein
MTLEECNLYRKVFEKYEPHTLRMAPSLPCSQLDLKEEMPKKHKSVNKDAKT